MAKYGEDAEGFYTMVFDANGMGKLGYRFAYKKEINPRETGITFTIDRACDLLSWDRNSQWTAYPKDHIGRGEGFAKALPAPNQLKLPVKSSAGLALAIGRNAGGYE